MWTLLISFLIHSFLDIVRKNKKNRFSKLQSPSRFYTLILNGAQNFKFPGDSDWLNFKHFSGIQVQY